MVEIMIQIKVGDVVKYKLPSGLEGEGMIIQENIIQESIKTDLIVVQGGAENDGLLGFYRIQFHRKYVTKVVRLRESLVEFWRYL